MTGDLLTWFRRIGSLRPIVARRQCEQMLLAFRVDMPLAPPAVNPAPVPGEFFQSGRVFLLELVGLFQPFDDLAYDWATRLVASSPFKVQVPKPRAGILAPFAETLCMCLTPEP